MKMLQDVNLAALRRDLARLAEQSRQLKRQLRATWVRPMAAEQRALVELRRRLTRLYVLRAWLRGRCHLRSHPRDGAYPGMRWEREAWHERVAERAAQDYLPDAAHRVAGAAQSRANR